METLHQNSQEISLVTGEFTDPELENDFFFHTVNETIAHLRRNLLIISLVFFAFIIPDFFLIHSQPQLITLFLIRILFLLFSVLYFFRIKEIPSRVYLLSTIYESLGAIFFWALIAFYENPDVVIHQQGLILVILGIFFIIPNRFINRVVISVIITAVFFAIAFLRDLFFISNYFLGLIVFSLLIIAFCAFIARRLNRLQRTQFLNTMELARISTTDSLTGCSNRMKYDKELEKEIARAQRYQLPLSGIMFDLDNFKEINDRFGHLGGDRVLKKIGLLVAETIRENDQLFRWGGEEFIVLLPSSDQRSAVQLAQRIQEAIRSADFTPVEKITCSFGVTSWEENDTADNFTQRLDLLQYQAKKNGKDKIVSDLATV